MAKDAIENLNDMMTETRKMVFTVSADEGAVKRALEGMDYIKEPVSYTHLDVYKRQGIFDPSTVVYYISLTVLFVFLTVNTASVRKRQ